MPFPTLAELSRVITQPPDPRVGLAAFQGGIDTLLAKQRMWQQQDQFDAELAQHQQEFDTTEGRLWNEQAAQEGVAYAKLGEQNRHNLAGEQQKRREAQSVAAKAVGEMLATGRHGDIEAMKPYLQSLGIMAEVAEQPPQLQAFAEPGVDMSFGLGKRTLRLSADGQPLGEVDLDRIEAQHRAGADGMLSQLVQGAPEMDRPAYETMARAARSSPEMMAQPAPDLFKSITSAAEGAAGQLHTDRNAMLNRQAAGDLANASRAGTAARADRSYQAMAIRTANTIRNQRVSEAMQISSGKKLVESERAAGNGVAKLDAAIKAGETLDGGMGARLAVGEIVRGLYGAASSNLELKSIWQSSFGSDAENKFNYFTGGGAIDRDQLQALRGVLHQSLLKLREQRLAIAQSARDNIMYDPAIQAMAPQMAQELANSGARTILGMGVDAAPVQPGEVEPAGPDGSLEVEAEAAEGEDPEINDFLGGWGQ